MDTTGHREPGAQFPYQRHEVRVEVPQTWAPIENMHAMQYNNTTGYVNQPMNPAPHYDPLPVRPEDGSPRPFPNSAAGYGQAQSATTSNAAVQSPSKSQPLDYSSLLIGLAEEYFAAAYGRESADQPGEREPDPHTFRKLISTGLACLETVLKVCLSISRFQGCRV